MYHVNPSTSTSTIYRTISPRIYPPVLLPNLRINGLNRNQTGIGADQGVQKGLVRDGADGTGQEGLVYLGGVEGEDYKEFVEFEGGVVGHSSGFDPKNPCHSLNNLLIATITLIE